MLYYIIFQAGHEIARKSIKQSDRNTRITYDRDNKLIYQQTRSSTTVYNGTFGGKLCAVKKVPRNYDKTNASTSCKKPEWELWSKLSQYCRRTENLPIVRLLGYKKEIDFV